MILLLHTWQTPFTRLVDCKEGRQLYIIPYKLGKGTNTLTIRRKKGEIVFNTADNLKYDFVDPFDYSRSHLNYKLSEEIFQTTDSESNDFENILNMNGSQLLNIKISGKPLSAFDYDIYLFLIIIVFISILTNITYHLIQHIVFKMKQRYFFYKSFHNRYIKKKYD